MIHFFPLFDKNAANTAYGEAIRAIGVEHRIFANRVDFGHNSRLELIFAALPRLALVALRSAWRSLVRAKPVPDVVIVVSDIEVLIFAFARFVMRRHTRIVHNTFIYTTRPNRHVEALRRRYYRFVLSFTQIAVVHSRIEIARNQALFPGLATKFVFVPYGLTVDMRFQYRALPRRPGHFPHLPFLVAAGRSGRDYATLFQAMQGLPAELLVICDFEGAVPPVPEGSHIRVAHDIYADEYFRSLCDADVVVLPLSNQDISAGQTVLIQAKALGCPLIVTDTPTSRDYVEPGVDAITVPPGDPVALRTAIQTLLNNPAQARALGTQAAASFDRNHGTQGFLTRLVEAVTA